METQQAFQLPKPVKMDTRTTPSWCAWDAVLYELPNEFSLAGILSEDEVKSVHAEVNDLQRRYPREQELPMIRH